MILLSHKVRISIDEIEFIPIRAQGAGGQNVNKVSSAIHLRFDIHQSSLPDFYKEKLLALSDQRISNDGILIIKAQKYRTQQRNKDDAIHRFQQLVQSAVREDKLRKPTRPSRSAQKKRIDNKKKHGHKKALRKNVTE